MRNRLRVLAFDVLAPLVTIAALIYVGIALAWPTWWVSVCSILCLLIVLAVVVDFVLFRRDGVTVGTDDDGPGLRLAVVGLAAVALVAAVVVGYTQWTIPDRRSHTDIDEVVGIASSVAEASATFTAQDPNASIDRAAALMTPDRADAYRKEFAAVTKDLASRNVSSQASTISAGVEAIGPTAASVAVVMRGTQNVPNAPPKVAVLALRVYLTNETGRWLVADVTPINSR
jgi:prepilin signal peptidase PulO-like enzyme (type II secretory pathway)